MDHRTPPGFGVSLARRVAAALVLGMSLVTCQVDELVSPDPPGTLVIEPTAVRDSAAVGSPPVRTQALGISGSGAGSLGWTATRALVTSTDTHSGTYSLDVIRTLYGQNALLEQGFADVNASELTIWVKGYVQSSSDYLRVYIKKADNTYVQLQDFTSYKYSGWTKVSWNLTSYGPVKGVKLEGYNNLADMSTMPLNCLPTSSKVRE